jgi:PPP family 3-phenylpropionic acid transporter
MRIAAFYFVFYMSMGLLVPYLPSYFKSLGCSGQQLALISSLGYLAAIFVPPVWGVLADRTRRPGLLMKLACLSAALAFVPMLWTTSFAAVFAAMAGYSLLVAPVIPLADTVAVAEARRMKTEYARLRLWGSIGFIVSALSFGLYLDHGGAFGHVPATVLAVMACYVVVALFNRPVPSEDKHPPPTLADARRLIAQPAFLLFLAGTLIHWAALSAYYLLFTIRLGDLHIGPKYAGWAFTFGVTAEILMMWCFRPLRQRVPVLLILAAASLLTSLRWLLVAYVENGPALAVIQIGHGFTFGACYVGSIAYLEESVPPQLMATGRALFASLVMGLGGMLGNMLAGTLYDIGGGGLAFLTSGLMELLVPLFLFAAWRASVAQRTAGEALAGK